MSLTSSGFIPSRSLTPENFKSDHTAITTPTAKRKFNFEGKKPIANELKELTNMVRKAK